MTTEENNTEIRELSAWNMPDTVSKPDGWDRKTLPEATADNMQIMMDKINELVQRVNKLTEANRHLIDKSQGNGVLPCVTTRSCFHSCKYLSITESEQNRLKVKDPHFCERYNKQIKHDGMHPRLPMLNECDYDNSEPRENRYKLPPLQFL